MSKVVLIGNKYNNLTIQKDLGMVEHSHIVQCVCDCGNIIDRRLDQIKSGAVKSCGCFKKSMLVKRNKANFYGTHNKSKTRLYRIWADMKQRCINPKQKVYKNYGGRGIKICDDWKSDFMTFYNWAMNNGYSDKLSIDRLDVNGNYEPNNCRWVNQKVQLRNTRRTIIIKIGNQEKCLKDWCAVYNKPYSTVCGRIKSGYSKTNALTKDRYKRGIKL